MDNLLNLLLIEDDEDDALLIVLELRRGGYDVQWERVQNEKTLRDSLAMHKWDAIISDYKLPHLNGPEALRILREIDKDIPCIVISGAIGEDTAVEMMKAGANDYLMKGHLTRLVQVMRREIQEAKVRKEKRKAEEDLREREELYRVLFEHSPYEVIVSTLDGVYVDVNEKFCASTGLSRAEVIGKSPSDIGIVSEERHITYLKTIEKNNGILDKFDSIIESKKYGTRHLQISARRVTVQGQTLMISVINDITQQKNAEQKIRHQLRELEGLHTIDNSISSSDEIKQILLLVLQQAMASLGVDLACFTLLRNVDKGEEQFKERFISGDTRISDTGLLNTIWPNLPDVQEKKTIILGINKFSQIPEDIRSLLQEKDIKTYAAAPAFFKNEMKGILEVFSKKDITPPDSDWINYLDSLAGQAAIAIGNSELLENLRKKNQELLESYENTILGWAKALEIRDEETFGHSERVLKLAMEVAESLSLSDEEKSHFRRGVLLHDIGKIGIPDSILLKPGPLDEFEWTIMRQHPVFAYRLLNGISFLQQALDVPYYHHERWDGSGYPHGLKGMDIPLTARIFAIVDVWDALMNDRPYRKAWDSQQTRDYLKKNAGIQFDPEIVDIFLGLDLENL